MWIVTISGTAATLLAFYTNAVIISKLKIWLGGKWGIARFLSANAFSKAILVAVAYSIPYYTLLTAHQLFILCLHTWLFKLIASVIVVTAAPPLTLMTQRIEKIDIHDHHVSYNPTKIFSKENSGENKYAQHRL